MAQQIAAECYICDVTIASWPIPHQADPGAVADLRNGYYQVHWMHPELVPAEHREAIRRHTFGQPEWVLVSERMQCRVRLWLREVRGVVVLPSTADELLRAGCFPDGTRRRDWALRPELRRRFSP